VLYEDGFIELLEPGRTIFEEGPKIECKDWRGLMWDAGSRRRG
jgi:hypothetical protein